MYELVLQVKDEEGGLMNDFTGRIKRDEWQPPAGLRRTVTVCLPEYRLLGPGFRVR